MKEQKPALIVIDMVRDYFNTDKPYPITPLARQIIPPINRLMAFFRENGFPVIFSTDAFEKDDFFFTGKMPPPCHKGNPWGPCGG